MGIVAAYAVPHPPLIIPGVGRGQEQEIAATIASYQEVARRIAAHQPETIIIASPHAPAYRDGFALAEGAHLRGDMQRFRDWEDVVECTLDQEFSALVEEGAPAAGIPLARRFWRRHPMDHAVFIPLYFVNQHYTDYRVVVVGLSGLSAHTHFKLGQLFAQVAGELDRRCVFIGSGDWSHKLLREGPYGYVPEGPAFDKMLADAFAANDLDAIFHFDEDVCERAAECGLRAFQIMAGALDGLPHNGELLSYEGPFGVGYGVACFEVDATA